MYFVTFRTNRCILNERERIAVLKHIKSGRNKFYTLVACVVMPDHVHVIFLADRGYSLTQVMKGMKGVSSHKVNDSRKQSLQVWQHESFDRIIRSEKELHGKLNYMLNNPVKTGIVEDPWEYPGWCCSEEYFKRGFVFFATGSADQPTRGVAQR
jgi:REP element-mobilizing transposase RayT